MRSRISSLLHRAIGYRQLAGAIICTSLLSASLGLAPQTKRAPRQIALLIGIADYKNFPKNGRPGESDLDGPPNDLVVMQRLLRGWGFSDPADVRILRDSLASKRAILRAFDWVVERADQPDDVVLIYFSGHGTYVRDENGDEAQFTPGDTLDEALVPWDAPTLTTAANVPVTGIGPRLLLDDEIRESLINRLSSKTRHVTVILDACYSGTATRGNTNNQTRPRGGTAAGNISGGLPDLSDPTDGGGYTLLTASSSQETAQEKGFATGTGPMRVNGVLTWALARTLAGAPRTARWNEILPDLRRLVQEQGVAQTPQLEGRQDGRVLDLQRPMTELAARDFSNVLRVSGDRITIDQGALHGLRAGTLLDVHAPADSLVNAAAVTQIRLDSLGDSTASGVIVGPKVAVAATARLVVARLPVGLSVPAFIPAWAPRTDTAARAQLARDSRFRIVDDRDSALAIVRVGIDSLTPRVGVDSGRAIRTLFAAGFPVVQVVTPPRGRVARFDACELQRAFGASILAGMLTQGPGTEGLQLVVNVREGDRTRNPGARPDLYLPPPDSVPTLLLKNKYTIWVWVNTAKDAQIYLSGIAGGLTGDIIVLPSGQEQPRVFPSNRWIPLETFTVSEPLGTDFVHVVASVDPFSFGAFSTSLGTCNGPPIRTAKGGVGTTDAALSGWVRNSVRMLLRPEQ